MKQLLLTLLLLTGIASAAAGDGISGNWRCQTISYQQYGNNYLIFIDNTHWQHKEDGSLHGEGKLESAGAAVLRLRLGWQLASGGRQNPAGNHQTAPRPLQQNRGASTPGGGKHRA